MNDLARATDLVLRVDAMSPLEHDVDLVAVGVVTPSGGEPLTGSVSKLDGLLGGAIEQMRTAASEGETRLVNGAPGVKARKVLLIGLGAHGSLRLEALQAAGRIAIEKGLALGAATIGFAPGLRDAGVTSFDVADVSHAIARGVRQGFATRDAATRTAIVFALESSPANSEQATKGIERTE
jgi:cytosol aminopeptidase family protein